MEENLRFIVVLNFSVHHWILKEILDHSHPSEVTFSVTERNGMNEFLWMRYSTVQNIQMHITYNTVLREEKSVAPNGLL